MDLLKNPFYILNASTRDSRRRIMELADERSLILESSECMKAGSSLTNPMKRLSAEVAWLPGIGPKRIEEILVHLESSPSDLLGIENLPSIARANLLATGLNYLTEYNAADVSEWILQISWAFEVLNSEDLIVVINEDRFIAEFPEVTEVSVIADLLKERQQYYRKAIKSALDKLYPKDLVKAVTIAVESATDNGEKHGPILIDDLVDAYEVEAQAFLDKEEENIKSLIDAVWSAVDEELDDATLAPMVNQLIQVVKNWDVIAQPIQVSTKSRGLDHVASHRVGGLVRNLALHMYNEHSKLEFTQQLTNMLHEVFVEVGKLAVQTSEDASVLDEIAERKKLSELLDPISDLCKKSIEASQKRPDLAFREANNVINSAPQLLASLSASNPSAEIYSQGKDEVALTLLCCAIEFGNKTENWKRCLNILDQALEYACSEEVKSKITVNHKTVMQNFRLFGDLEPISSAPSLYTFNGIGTMMYGSTDHEPESNSYVSTYYFVILGIPIFPISRYRVIPTANGYRFLGKAPLRTFDKWHTAISLGLIALIVISFQ